MARKKNNDTMRLAAVSAVVSLFIVIIFFGGSLTGNASIYAVTVDVSETIACTFSPANSTLDFGTISGVSTDGDTSPTVTVTNDGTGDVDVNVTEATDIDTFLGGTGTELEIAVTVQSGSTTLGSKSNLTDNTATVAADSLTPTDTADDAVLTFTLQGGPGISSGNSQSQASGITVSCSAAE